MTPNTILAGLKKCCNRMLPTIINITISTLKLIINLVTRKLLTLMKGDKVVNV